MRYNCRYCDYIFDGQMKDFKQVFEHEKTHPENKMKWIEDE
jgi:rubredoxin